MGDVSNNGTSDVDYVAGELQQTTAPGTGAFRDGATTSSMYADFDENYDPVNGLTYDNEGSLYTVGAGDTLSSIAQTVWGDSSMWYLIADANGLVGDETMVAGQDLTIPNKVTSVNVHNTASTFKPYDPNTAMGATAPTAPRMPQHQSGCGGWAMFCSPSSRSRSRSARSRSIRDWACGGGRH